MRFSLLAIVLAVRAEAPLSDVGPSTPHPTAVGRIGSVLPAAPSIAPGRIPPAAPDPLALGRERYAEGDLAGTVSALAPWLSGRGGPWGRTRTAGHLLLGMAHYGLEEWNLASEHFYRVRRTGGPLASFGAWYEALVDHRRNRHTVAVRECSSYRKKWPEGPHADDCLLLIGDAWAAHGNRILSVQAYTDYLEAHPDSPRKEEIRLATALAYTKTRPETGIALLHELALDHSYPSTDLAVTAELKTLAAAGHKGTAVPEGPNDKMRRAWSLRNSGKFKEAWDLFTDLSNMADENKMVAKWVENHGDRFAWLTRNYDVYANALTKDYEARADPETAWQIFVAWSRAGEWAEAARWGRIGLERHARHPRWRSAEDNIAWAALLAGEYEDAAERWGSLAKRGGELGRKSQFYNGLSLYRAGRFEAAASALTPLTNRPDWRAAAHYWRAKAHAQLGRANDTENDRALARVHDRFGWYSLLLDNLPEEERVVLPLPALDPLEAGDTDGATVEAAPDAAPTEESPGPAGSSSLPADSDLVAVPTAAQQDTARRAGDEDGPLGSLNDPNEGLDADDPPPVAMASDRLPRDSRSPLERGTASWPARTGRWHGVSAATHPSLPRPQTSPALALARQPRTASPAAPGQTRPEAPGRDTTRRSFSKLSWQNLAAPQAKPTPTASPHTAPASSHSEALPLAGHVLPDGYPTCRWYDRDTASQEFLEFSERHKRLWPKLPAAYDLAQAGLYTDAAKVLFDIYEEWRIAVRAGANRDGRQQQIAALGLRLPHWRPFLLLVRDHYHAARSCWGLEKHALDEAERNAALRMGYPLVRPELVWRESQRYNVDPYLVYGIMRQESTYQNAALSPVGAIGLIQVMPATGARVAAMLGEHRYSPGDLEEPTINLRYGIFYLSRLLDRFDGVFPLAVASYNGGPHNVSRWYRPWASGTAGKDGIPLDVFVETILYDETRDYVKRVSGHYARYISIYEGGDTQVLLPRSPKGDDADVIDF